MRGSKVQSGSNHHSNFLDVFISQQPSFHHLLSSPFKILDYPSKVLNFQVLGCLENFVYCSFKRYIIQVRHFCALFSVEF